MVLPSGSNITIDKKMDPIEGLNRRANEIAHAEKDNPTWESIRQGNPVYVHRVTPLVYGFTLLSAYFVLNLAREMGLVYFSLMVFVGYVYTDFKGGNLHVMLDEPKNIHLPLIGQAALEFQMHHAIPQDNAIKPFAEMCGDLNMYVLITYLVAIAQQGGVETYSMGFAGMQVLFGYMGQYAHRATHMSPKQRPEWAKKLQAWGVLLPAKMHAKHHQTYDDNFCILSGWCSPLFTAVCKITTNRWFWIAVFFGTNLTDGLVIPGIFRSLAQKA